MKSGTIRVVAVSVIALLFAWLGSEAVASEERKILGGDLSLGIGPGLAPDYEGSDDYDLVPVPYGRLSWGRRYVELQGLKLKANLRTHPNWELGPVINFRKEAFDNADDNRVKKLDGDGNALEVGPFLGYRGLRWDSAIEVTKDVADGHEGWLTKLETGYSMQPNHKTRVRLGLETTYGSGDYMNEYFGIDRRNAVRSRLREYDADKGFRDWGANVAAFYDIRQNWTIVGLATFNRLLADAADSPVVDDRGDENQFFMGVVGIYHF
jgi:outer membrane protein